MIAYILLPAVEFVQRKTKLSQNLSIAIVYIFIFVILLAIPALTIPQLIDQTNNLITNTPTYVQEIGEALNEPLTELRVVDVVQDVPLADLVDHLGANLIEIIRTVGPQ